MQLVLKKKAVSLKECFTVTDAQENALYNVEGKAFSWGHQLDVTDASGARVAHIRQKLLALTPHYFITLDGGEEMELKGHLTLIHPHYTLETPEGDWEVRGDFTQHEYTITRGEETVASVSQKWFAWGDTYLVDVAEDKNAVPALCVMIALNCVDADTIAASAGSAN